MKFIRGSFVIYLLCCALFSQAATQRTGLKKALEQGLVSLVAKSHERYNGKGLSITIHNKTRQALQVTIDPALIFRSMDTAFQHLVIMDHVVVALPAQGDREVPLQTFCAKSYAHAPATALPYAYARQGDSNMIRVLQFIEQYHLFNDAGQQAVWVLTNHHSLDAVYDPEQPAVSAKLVALLSKLTGQPAPDYYRTYKLDTMAGAPVL